MRNVEGEKGGQSVVRDKRKGRRGEERREERELNFELIKSYVFHVSDNHDDHVSSCN